jgi:outer membrane protein OmpA-like peptidoglycan-associated protein
MLNWLSCASRPSQKTFVYTWTFVGVGGGGDEGFFGGSYYRGNMVIERTRPKEGKWKKTYPAFVGGFSVGRSKGTQAGLKMAEGTLRSNYEWDQENFVGRYNLYEASLLSINNPTGEHAVDKTTIEFFGDGKLPSLSGVAEQTAATGLGIGAGSAVLLGQIYADGSELAKKLKLVKAEDKKLPVNSAYGAAGQLHFDVDATTLTDDGRQLLREMLATHLAVFSNPESELRIDGHASPSGPSEHNTELSWIRAVNVLQAIDDILGHSFKIKPDNIIIWGWGEELSAKALGDKDVESAEWRKVDIRLDGKIAMTLRAP